MCAIVAVLFIEEVVLGQAWGASIIAFVVTARKTGLGPLLAPEGETWPLGVGRGVDLGVDIGSSVRLSARRLAILRRFVERESSRFGCGMRSSTSTEEIIVSADKARVRLRVTDDPPVTPISSRRGSSCACGLSSKTSKMGSSILERYSP